jgi:hypothetical protein
MYGGHGLKVLADEGIDLSRRDLTDESLCREFSLAPAQEQRCRPPSKTQHGDQGQEEIESHCVCSAHSLMTGERSQEPIDTGTVVVGGEEACQGVIPPGRQE